MSKFNPNNVICDTFADLYIYDGIKYTAEKLYKALKEDGQKPCNKSVFHAMLRHHGTTVNLSLSYLETCNDEVTPDFAKIIQDKLGIYDTKEHDCDWRLFADFMVRTIDHVTNPTKSAEPETLLLVGGDKPIWETLFGEDLPYVGVIYTFIRTRDVKTVLKKIQKARLEKSYQPLRTIGYIVDNTDGQIQKLRDTTSKRYLKLIKWKNTCDIEWLKENRSKVWSFFKEYKQ